MTNCFLINLKYKLERWFSNNQKNWIIYEHTSNDAHKQDIIFFNSIFKKIMILVGNYGIVKLQTFLDLQVSNTAYLH